MLIEILEYLIVFILIGLIFLMPAFLLYSGIRWIRETLFTPTRVVVGGGSKERITVSRASIETLLSYKFEYFRKLSAADKEKFLQRITRFILNKEFRAMKMELTEEMVVLISASAIQLTFGLNEYLLDHFGRIYIYPREFVSRTSKKAHKGETNLAGAIVFSWKHFKEGYDNPKDNVNLGLHEMSHALKFNRIVTGDSETSFAEYLNKWLMVSKEEFLKLRNRESDTLREYGGANSSEFFSVCVEYFFESPNEFKQKLPDVYKHMCILLNQDPAAGITQYAISQKAQAGVAVDNASPLLEFSSEKSKISVLTGSLALAALFIFISLREGGLTKNWSSWIIILIASGTYGYQFFISKKKFVLYPGGIALRSVVSVKLDKLLKYDEIASVRLSRIRTEDSETNSVTIFSTSGGRIRKHRYNFKFRTDEEVSKAASFLQERKIPVKVIGYNTNNHSSPIYRR